MRIAVGLRRVDPQDVPESAKAKASPVASTSAPPGPSQKKRKAEFEAQYGTQPSSSSQAVRSQTQHLRQLVDHPIVIDDDEEENVSDDTPIDELYVTLRTNIVGVQYYKGA